MDQLPSLTRICLEVDGAVATMTLNDPERLNPLSPEMLSEITETAGWIERQPNIRVVVVKGAGRSFSAGADLDMFQRARPDLGTRAVAELGGRMADAIEGMRPIAIAQIHGHCVGGAVVLAAACDLRVAADDAYFSIPEVDLGIPLAWGGIPRLVREIGPALAKELVMTCRPFTSPEALAAGFLNRVVPPAQLEDEVAGLASVIAAKPDYPIAVTKRHVNAVTDHSVAIARSWSDADTFVAAMSDPEGREAARRYVEAVRRRRTGEPDRNAEDQRLQ